MVATNPLKRGLIVASKKWNEFCRIVIKSRLVGEFSVTCWMIHLVNVKSLGCPWKKCLVSCVMLYTPLNPWISGSKLNAVLPSIQSHDSMPWKKSSTLRAMGWWNRSHFKIVVKSSRGWIPGPLKIRWWCCRSAWVKPDFRKSSPLIFFAAYLTFYWWDKVTGFNSIYIYIFIFIYWINNMPLRCLHHYRVPWV